jgi:hypothetical protein
MVLLADAEHEARLGDEALFGGLGHPQDLERLPEGGARIADERRPRLGCLHVVGVDVEAGPSDELDGGGVASKVAGEGFDEDVGRSACG